MLDAHVLNFPRRLVHIEVVNESTQSRPYAKYMDLKCELSSLVRNMQQSI